MANPVRRVKLKNDADKLKQRPKSLYSLSVKLNFELNSNIPGSLFGCKSLP